MNRQGSAAYEYERFAEPKKPQIQKVPQSAKPKKHKIGGVRAVCYMLAIGVMLSMLVYSKMVQTELNDQYQSTMLSINAKRNENTRARLQLESRFSQENVGRIARDEYGMESPTAQQYEYITFDTQNKAEVLNQSSFWDNLSSWFYSLFQ